MAGKKVYRTASGQEVDLQKLLLKNEKVRAVGNMNVNARGDVLDSGNKNIASRREQVNKQYRKQIGNVPKDLPVVNSKKAAKIIAEKYVTTSNEAEVTVEDMITGLDDEAATEEKIPVESKVAPEEPGVNEESKGGGLADAIAKAREIKQEPLKTPREEARNSDGVKKI